MVVLFSLSQVRQTTMVWLYLTVSRLMGLFAQVDLMKEISSKLRNKSFFGSMTVKCTHLLTLMLIFLCVYN